MEIDVYQVLADNTLLLIFLVLGIGFLLGNIKILGLRVGGTIGVLITGLVFGNFGLTINPMVGTFGFALFIFSVGLQAGPSFFSAFAVDGVRYVLLSLLVALCSVALVLLFSQFMTFEPGMDAGLLAGALTSTPSLAGAQDAFKSGLGNTGELSVAMAVQNVNIGYAITYLGGTIGMIMFVRYVPQLIGVDLMSEAAALERERGITRVRSRAFGRGELPIIRAYQIEDPQGQSISQRRVELNLKGAALGIKRGEEFVEASPDLVLEKGDIVSLFAGLDVHEAVQEKLGHEVLEPTLLDYEVVSRDIIVVRHDAVGHTLASLELLGRYGCFASGVTRSGIELPFSENIVLNRGDLVRVTGERTRVAKAADAIGQLEEDVQETDLVTFSFGIAIGVLLGMVVVKLGDLSIGLGMAGGLLISGILIGSASSLNPTFGRVPQAARYLLMDLGLMLFMAGVGLNAGGGMLEALASVGLKMVLCGLAITLLPAALAYLIGRRIMKLNPALLLGSVTGAMTSTPALNVLNDLAKSPVPALGYAGTYTIANVMLTFAGTMMAMV